MEEGRRLADIPNPNAQYPNQRLLGAEIGGYACCVPYVEDRDEMFLKTIYPSRRFTELYLKG